VSAAARADRQVRFFTHVAADSGYPLPPNSTVLDFGCGEGEAVTAWREAGHRAFGCDIVLDHPSETLRVIETPYRLPFDDATFDLVVSNEVLEHVQDYSVALAEIRRVLKRGGISLHLFPARWPFLEPHTFVPLATLIQGYWWLGLWARLGIRNVFQKGQPWQQVARFNTDYLRDRTNYPPNRRLLAESRRWFSEVRFINSVMIKHGNRMRRVYPLVRALPVLADAYGVLRARLLLLA
jgi:SAM-dependent methyltransferase